MTGLLFDLLERKMREILQNLLQFPWKCDIIKPPKGEGCKKKSKTVCFQGGKGMVMLIVFVGILFAAASALSQGESSSAASLRQFYNAEYRRCYPVDS